MDFRTIIDDRHSIRTFEARPVGREKIERILHAAGRAPSAGNLQSYKIALVTSKKLIQGIAATKPEQTWIATAPVILVFLGDSQPAATIFNSEGQSLYTVQDATIACAYAQLAVADEGLGSCWVGTPSVAEEIRNVLGLPETLRPMSLLPLGYIGGPPLMMTTRKPAEEMVIEFNT